MRKSTSMALIGLFASVSAFNANAAYITYFGEDLNSSASVRLTSTPNSTAAESDFLSQLSGVGTEDFESFSNGTSQPLNLTFPGAGTATLNGGNGKIVTRTSGAGGVGRYPISGDNFWEIRAGSSGDFSIDFDTPVAAFGFYGIDIGDFGGQLTLALANGLSTIINVPATSGGAGNNTDGSVLYFGLIGNTAADQFNSVTFNSTSTFADDFGFDDLTVGTLSQLQTVPEPSSIALLGIGLLGFAGIKKKSQRV